MNPQPPTQASETPQCCDVPLVEILESVPVTAREVIEVSQYNHRNIPYGKHCHDAAKAIRSLELQLSAALLANKQANSAIEDIANECKSFAEQLSAAKKDREELVRLQSRVGFLEGVLMGITHWEIPTELKEKINNALKTL